MQSKTAKMSEIFFFKISKNMIERCTNKKKMKNKNIEKSKHLHLMLYNYLKDIVKKNNFKTKKAYCRICVKVFVVVIE